MPPTPFSPNDPRHVLAAWLLISLIYCGVSAWVKVWRRRQQQLSWLDRCDEPRAAWTGGSERLALLLAWLWFGLHLASKIAPEVASKPRGITHAALWSVVALSGGTTLLLIALLLGTDWRSARQFGLKGRPLASPLRDGWFGFQLAILPMAVAMVVMAPFRTRDTQNPLLTLLSDNLDPVTIALVVFIAVVIAPLSEELIFRVILQGWLRTVLPARWAIPFVAVSFAAIHGPVDGPALLPLSLVLGGVFERRHSYATVVVIHGLFNATMLALALLTVK